MFSWFSSLFKKRIPQSEWKKLLPLQQKIQYTFKDPSILKRGLTHKSFANENKMSALEQNERYEFLGDAVLELAISHLLMEKFPDSTEGDLSKLRAAVVNEQSLAEIARRIHLGNFLYLGRGEDQCGGREKDSLLSDAYEAVLGAIYLDSDFPQAFKVIQEQFASILHKATKQDIIRDFKTKLQEEAQELFKSIPRYKMVSESGPDHNKTFEVHLFIRSELFGKGVGKSKKQAEQNAAGQALIKLETIKAKSA